MSITALLDTLADYHDNAEALRLDYEQRRADILAPVQDALVELDTEYAVKQATIATRIAEGEAAVKAAVLTVGASVKGARLYAVWSKGRVSWDTKKLDGLMIAVPQLAQCRSEGAPSVSIRKV